MEKLSNKLENLKNVFGQIKAEKDVVLKSNPRELYVHIPAAEVIKEFGPYIFIGRKGIGKTALVDHYKDENKTKYDIVIDIIADQDHSWLLYNFYHKKFNDIHRKVNDVKDLFDLQTLFSTAWSAAIQTALMERVIRSESLDGRFEAEREIIAEYLKREFKIERDRPSTNIAQKVQSLLPFIFDLIQNKIEKLLELDNAVSLGVILSRFTNWITESIDIRLIDRKANEALQKILVDGALNVLITLDKYDDYVDSLILELDDVRQLENRLKRQYTRSERLDERANILAFQRSMLRGLVIASKELREQDGYKNLHYAFAIPHDRFTELRLRESADLDTKYISQIKWTPLHLLEFFVRRCNYALGNKSEATTYDELIKEYKKILKELNIDEHIQNTSVPGVKEDFLLYLIRHSLWRPRDIQRYLIEIFRNCQSSISKDGSILCQKIIQDVVREVSPSILDSEFFIEYQAEYPLLEDVVMRFRQQPNIIEDDYLRDKILGKRGISLSHTSPMSTDEIITRLYNVGFLGIRSKRQLNPSMCIRQKNQLVYYCFYYNEEVKNLNSIFGGGAKLSEDETWVIHPVFYDRLDSKVSNDYVVHEMTWQSIIAQYGSFYYIKED